MLCLQYCRNLFYLVINDFSYTEAAVQKVQKRIEEAFDVFDHEGNKTVDVREIGTIMRSLDLCPTENELGDVITEVNHTD